MQQGPSSNTMLVLTSHGNLYYGNLVSLAGRATFVNAYRIYSSSPEDFYTKVVLRQYKGGKISRPIENLVVSNIVRSCYITINVDKLPEVQYNPMADLGFEGTDFDALDIACYNNLEVISINKKAFALEQTHSNVNKGFLINPNLSASECYSITFGKSTAFGKTLKQAYESVKELILNTPISGVENIDYASAVVRKYPNVDAVIPVLELVELHHLITDSCSDGIREFCAKNNINLNGTATMRLFLTTVKDAEKPELIQSIAQKYGITI